MSPVRRVAGAAVLVLLGSVPSSRAAAPAGDCQRADLVPAGPDARVDPQALLDAACGPDCVLECADNREDEGKDHVLAHFEGSFRCAGKLESIVGLFPCDDAAGMHGVAGTIVHLRAKRAKKGKATEWERAGEIPESVLGTGECKVARVDTNDTLVCSTPWGPYQGITGESLCAYGAKGTLDSSCPLRVEDNCESGLKPARAATIEGWTIGAAASGVIPIKVTLKRADCAGKSPRTIEATVLLDASGARLSPETAALLKKLPVSSD